MALGHGHDHDGHHEDSHGKSGDHSHESHEGMEDEDHAPDTKHTRSHRLPFDSLQDNEDSAEVEEDPIEPAGTINDLFYSLGGDVDVTGFFEFSEMATIEHNHNPVFRDISRALTYPEINLSQRLILRTTPSEERSVMADLYPSHSYLPKPLRLGSAEFTPRFETIHLCEPLPLTQENTVDIRELSVFEGRSTHPDIYLMPVTLQRRMNHLRVRYGRTLLKATAIVIITGTILTGTLSVMMVLAKEEITKGYQELEQLSLRSDTTEAKRQINGIRQHFERASWWFLPMRYIVGNGVIQHESLENGYHALYAGTAISELLTAADQIHDDFSGTYSGVTLTEYFDPRLVVNTRISITDYLKNHREELSNIRKYISQAHYHFSSITTTGDLEQDIRLTKVTAVLKRIETISSYAELHGNDILDLLGDKKPMNYLILNQNRDELRANGGFPGSAVEVSLYKGKVEKFEKKDIYFYDWHLFPYAEVPPPGINQITKTWGIRDANYYPDIQDSFEVIRRMYERAGGNSLDSLVAINQGMIEDILSVTGPIRVLGVPDEIDASSFSLLISVLVEGEYGRRNSAKDILFLAIEALQNRVLEDKKFDVYVEKIQNNIRSGQVLVAMRDENLRTLVNDIFGKPKFRDNPDNFVYPVFTSISGNKSDRYMSRTFDIANLSQSGCTITNRFGITSEHTFSTSEREKIRNMLYRYGVDPKEHEHELYVQGNGDNVQYVRLLIPKNSSLVGVSKELEKTLQWNIQNPEYDEVSFMITTSVGKTSSGYIDYRTTPTSCLPQLQFIEQPGLKNFKVRTP